MAPLGALSQAWVSAEASLPLGWRIRGLWRFGEGPGIVRSGLLVLLLVLLLGSAGGCAFGGCPGALLQGVLIERDGELVVAHVDGDLVTVDWSASGHSVRDDDDELVVTDWLGIVKAREGDFVSLGGSGGGEAGWLICGMFEVGDSRAS